jgi:hypothetical protein
VLSPADKTSGGDGGCVLTVVSMTTDISAAAVVTLE